MPTKSLIAIAVMLGATLEILDTSIVNVSLPHMQGSFSASVDEITWVLTSYLVANGIMIPMTGWISSRFGRKRYFLGSVVTFVFASALCGAAQDWTQMVIFRLLQGAAGRRDDPVVAGDHDGDLSAQEQADGDGDVGWALSPRRSSVRRWADGLPTTGTGAGTSTSICRWAAGDR